MQDCGHTKRVLRNSLEVTYVEPRSRYSGVRSGTRPLECDGYFCMATENRTEAARCLCYANPFDLAARADAWVGGNAFRLAAVVCFT